MAETERRRVQLALILIAGKEEKNRRKVESKLVLISTSEVFILSFAFFHVVFSAHKSRAALSLEDFNDFDMVNLNLVHGYVEPLQSEVSDENCFDVP